MWRPRDVENLTVYDDSISQWAADGSLPVETD
jgi:3-mercaptopyruvate sulfurtransferase SseA